jgi:hypothetical protein
VAYAEEDETFGVFTTHGQHARKARKKRRRRRRRRSAVAAAAAAAGSLDLMHTGFPSKKQPAYLPP